MLSRSHHRLAPKLLLGLVQQRAISTLQVSRAPTFTSSCKSLLQQYQRNNKTKTGTCRRRWKSDSNEVIQEPSFADLRLVALAQAIPFIGFGFMDNAILIIAGDAIDTSLGIMFGMSTLCAAAIGNIISDLAGIGLGTMIEDFCANVLKLPVPNISAAQRQLRSVRMASNIGMATGMTFGCIVGMFPLLFLDSKKIEQMKKAAQLESLFRDVVTEAKTLIGAESTCLYLRVQAQDNTGKSSDSGDASSSSPPLPGGKTTILPLKGGIGQMPYKPSANGNYLYAMYDAVPKAPLPVEQGEKEESASALPQGTLLPAGRLVQVGKGIISRAVLTREPWNIPNVHVEPDFAPEWYDSSTVKNLKHMIVVPVLDSQGRAIGVIRANNKAAEGRSSSSSSHAWNQNHKGFSDEDVQILKTLASHISVSLQTFFQDDEVEAMRLRDTIRILKEHGLEGISGKNKGLIRRRRTLFPESDEERMEDDYSRNH